MTGQVSLDPQMLEAALAVLGREQAAYLPTARQTRLYRGFNISAFSLAGVGVLWFIVMSMSDEIALSTSDTAFVVLAAALTLVAALLSLSTMVLFFMNWGLIRNLYRLAQLRRRLKLAGYFEPAFSAQRKATRFGNAVTVFIILLGGWAILVGLLGVVAGFLMLDKKGFLVLSTPQFFIVALLSLAVIAVGVGLVSLHFVRRGKQRLEIVLRLQERLATQAAEPAQAAEVKVSSDEYAAIAGLERAQIICDRASSILSARKEAEAPGYLYQASRQMHEAKSRLPPELLAKVEGTIAGLLADPAPAKAGDASPEGSRILPVAGTSLKIEFDVDPDRHVVRLHDLRDGALAQAMGR